MLLCLTANHRNASFEILEKLSLGAPKAVQLLVDGTPDVRGAVVLATCNRFEAYLEVEDESLSAAALRTVEVMGQASGVDPAALGDAVTVITGDGVARHLFAVSSGLESVVVGEDEISGQVQRALERARTIGTTTSALEQLFQRATQTSRGVKSRTALGGAGRSLVRLALELASSRVVDWADTQVLIVGTGQYAATTVAAIRDRGVTAVSVYSPSGRAAAFATKYGLHFAANLADAISASDIVITCTASAVVDTSVIVDSRRRLIIDLGLPRNVDPSVAHLPGVELLDLETISLHAPLEELNATADARALIGLAAADFAADATVEPAIIAFRRHILGILDTELRRAAARGDSSDETKAALRHITSVLLHTPSVRARDLARQGRGHQFVEALESLYGVTPAAEADSRRQQAGEASA